MAKAEAELGSYPEGSSLAIGVCGCPEEGFGAMDALEPAGAVGVLPYGLLVAPSLLVAWEAPTATFPARALISATAPATQAEALDPEVLCPADLHHQPQDATAWVCTSLVQCSGAVLALHFACGPS